MGGLGARDLKAALGFVLQAGTSDDLHAFRAALVAGIQQLVACDSIGYNEIDIDRKAAIVLVDPPDLLDGDLERRFLDLAHQHPLVARQQAGDLGTYAMSDFLTGRELHRLELYQDFYKQVGAEDQIAFGLPGDAMVAVALNRSRRTFSQRNRELLELVRPHLTATYTHLREKERTRDLIAALDEGLHEQDAGVIQLDERHRIEHATGAARELLCAYLDHEPRSRHRLPQRLRAWLDARGGNGSRPSLVIDSFRGRLCVRELHGGAGRAECTLILEEHRARPPSVEALRSLGLTRRQAQVLRLLACGKQSSQIAAELQISVATVSKHLEHVYAHLGVSSRTQAIARVHR